MDGSAQSRREFIRLAAAGAVAALALGPLGCGRARTEETLRKRFREMSAGEKEAVVRRLEQGYLRKYGKAFRVGIEPAVPETLWGYGLDLSRCIGCRRCVYACVAENNPSRINPQLHWIRVVRLKKGSLINLEESEHYYNPETVPEPGFLYLPVQCQQCADPPCVRVCPVRATWQEPDGIVAVDYDWCIGCRYCIAACPYRGRVFNWAEPTLPSGDANGETHYLGNRPRMKHVVEKCTFCLQRVRGGRYPACVEACPTGTRKFGNLLDAGSEIRYLIEKKRVFRLKEDLNTDPRFYYFFSA